jgi:hypothetical protein
MPILNHHYSQATQRGKSIPKKRVLLFPHSIALKSLGSRTDCTAANSITNRDTNIPARQNRLGNSTVQTHDACTQRDVRAQLKGSRDRDREVQRDDFVGESGQRGGCEDLAECLGVVTSAWGDSDGESDVVDALDVVFGEEGDVEGCAGGDRAGCRETDDAGRGGGEEGEGEEEGGEYAGH